MLKVSLVSFKNRHANKKEKNEVNVINKALTELRKLELASEDMIHVRQMGVKLPFYSGKSAYDFIKDENIKIKFAQFNSPLIHAQWDFNTKTIKLNNAYKNTTSPAEILALSEAIFHEAGHAKDMDSRSSIQEELDCLALNALGYRTHSIKYPDAFKENNSNIVKKGVNLYADLYFPPSPTLFTNEGVRQSKLSDPYEKLVERIKTTYRDLPAGDFYHPPGYLALKIKES